MRVLFTIITTLLLLQVSVVTVSAQGSWECFWSNAGSQCGITHSCEANYSYPSSNPCSGATQAACSGSGSCVLSGGETEVKIKSGPPIEDGCIDTAIGCIPIASEQALATFFLTWGMGLGGGIALILIVIASFMVMTSAGDPKKLQAGKELLTSAVSGLIILVFAAYILNFVGVELLGIY